MENPTQLPGQATVQLEVSNTTAPLLGSGPAIALNSHVTINGTPTGLPVASNFYFDEIDENSYDPVTGLYSITLHVTAAQFAPNPAIDQTVQSLSQVLSLTPDAGGVDGYYTVYVVDNNTFYIFNGTGLPSSITSWTPYSNVQPLTGAATANISINVV